jgi:hypothetical protein
MPRSPPFIKKRFPEISISQDEQHTEKQRGIKLPALTLPGVHVAGRIASYIIFTYNQLNYCVRIEHVRKKSSGCKRAAACFIR